MSCCCPEPRVGLLETPPRWHTTIYMSCESVYVNWSWTRAGTVSDLLIYLFTINNQMTNAKFHRTYNDLALPTENTPLKNFSSFTT